MFSHLWVQKIRELIIKTGGVRLNDNVWPDFMVVCITFLKISVQPYAVSGRFSLKLSTL